MKSAVWLPELDGLPGTYCEYQSYHPASVRSQLMSANCIIIVMACVEVC